MTRRNQKTLVIAISFFSAIVQVACGGGTSSQPQHHDPVTITPKSANLMVLSQGAPCGCGQQQFQAFIQGSSTTAVDWLVNGIPGGSSAVGVISSNGLYLPPNEVPSEGITVTALSAADSTQSDSANVTLQYPAAGATSVSPLTIKQGSGASNVTVSGGPYSDAAVVYLAGNPLPTTFMSTNQVSAVVPAGSLVSSATLLFGVKNPAPGGGGGDGTSSTNSAPLYVVAGAYVRVGDVNTARQFSAATLLSSGKVLVTGGSDLSSTEVFDPQSNTFQTAGTMTVARTGHSATTLNNGKILIAGGTPNPTTAEIYDPDTNTSTPTPPMNFAHTNVAILLTDGRVLLQDWGPPNYGVLALNAEVYDPGKGTFTIVTNGTPTCVNSPPAPCCLGGGVLGTQNLAYAGLPYYLDLQTLTYTLADPARQSGQRGGCSVTVLPQGKVFTTYGGDALTTTNLGQIWDSNTDTVTPVTLHEFRSYNSAVLLQNGQVLVLSGLYGQMDEIVNPTLAESFVAPLPLFNRTVSPTVVLLKDGRVLVVGGESMMPSGIVASAVAETYVP